jgi:hypothetical protein
LLNDLLGGGPVSQTEIIEAAEANLISKRTLDRAKSDLKVEAHKEKGKIDGKWYWRSWHSSAAVAVAGGEGVRVGNLRENLPRRPSVKVLNLLLLFKGGQGCQFSFPGQPRKDEGKPAPNVFPETYWQNREPRPAPRRPLGHPKDAPLRFKKIAAQIAIHIFGPCAGLRPVSYN